ncbi:hypothetical protein [Campylobacter pinnipediorum]|nr:hypothetical protein [Campylobacter pinnipediorum]
MNDLAQVAIQHANTTISIANTFLVWGGIFIAIVTFYLPYISTEIKIMI